MIIYHYLSMIILSLTSDITLQDILWAHCRTFRLYFTAVLLRSWFYKVLVYQWDLKINNSRLLPPTYFEHKFLNRGSILSGWPSGLRRQTQGTCLTPMIGSCRENSGPRMRAWVQIPLLTATFWKIFYWTLGNISRTKIQGKKVSKWGYLRGTLHILGSVAERSKALV